MRYVSFNFRIIKCINVYIYSIGAIKLPPKTSLLPRRCVHETETIINTKHNIGSIKLCTYHGL